MHIIRAIASSLCVALSIGVVAQAAPKPAATPGGSNQLSAISGKIGDTLWNGQIRFKLVEVRPASPGDHPESVVPTANQNVWVVTAIIRNGTASTWSNLVTYTLADKDDVTYDIPGHFFNPVSLNIAQAGATRQTALVPLDKSFVPVKLIFTCGTCGKNFKPFRVTLHPPAQ